MSSHPTPAVVPYAPGMCYAQHPQTGQTILLIAGRAGFYPAQSSLTSEQLNSCLSVTPDAAQVRLMLHTCLRS